MKINLFAPFDPIQSGVVTYCEDLAQALEKRAVEVNRVNRAFWSSYRLGMPGVYQSPTLYLLDRALTLAVSPFYGLPRDSQHAVNHFHVSGGYFNHLNVKHFWRVKGPRVITVHDQNFVTPRIFSPYDETAQLAMLRQSDLVIVHTDELKHRLEFINPRMEMIGHGVWPEQFSIDPAEAKKRIGVRGTVVSQIGFMFNYKGIQNFIKAVSQIEATVLIVGSGPDEAAIKKLADYLCPGKIDFRPYVPAAEFPYYVAASDILVFPRSHSQGECSGVLVQAMAAGKALIAHDIGCFKEYLGPERGILVEPENISDLRSAILTLLDDSELRTRYGQACKRYTQNYLGWDLIAEKHIALYEQLLTRRASLVANQV